MKTLKMLMLTSVIVFATGCKVAVIVVEGGEVQSVASGTCMAGTVCINQVNGTNYTETFTAVADPGWKFVRWNNLEGSLCADRTDTSCTLSTTGFEGKPGFEAVINSSTTFYLMPIFNELTPITDTVTVDDKIWAQVDLFTNLSWDDINDVCPTGICTDNGVLNDLNMTGWTWASVDDVNALFNYYIGSDVLGPGPDYLSDSISVWGPAFFRDGWRITYSAPNVLRITQGWVNGALGLGDGYLSYLMDVEDTGGWINDELDTRKTPLVSNDVGGWFYRAP